MKININKNKPKQKKTKSRPKPVPRRTSRKSQAITTMATMAKPHRLLHKLCGLTDPFCDHAIGAKWPDDNALRTLPFSSRTIGSLNVGPNGEGALLFIPGYYFQTVLPTVASAGVATFGAATNVLATLPATQSYRLVSWGFRFKNVLAPLNSSGMVRIRGLTNINGTLLNSVDSSIYNDFSEDIPLQNCADVAVIGRKSNETHHFFRSPDETNTSNIVTGWVSPGFAPVMIYVVGAPASTAPLHIEFVYNYELTWPDGDAMNYMATPSPPANTMLTQAASKVSTVVGNVFSRGISAAGKAIENYALQAIGSAIGGRFGGPAGARAGAASALALTNAMEVD